MNAYQLISELYRILGDVDKGTLEEAQRMVGPSAMASVLNALAVVADDEVSQAARHSTSASRRARPARERMQSYRLGLDASAKPNDLRKQIASILERSTERLTTAEVIRALKTAGVEVAMRPKESRSKYLRRAASQLATMPAERRRLALDSLRQGLDIDPETAGWVQVIRRPYRQ
jgi:hypothetical protein